MAQTLAQAKERIWVDINHAITNVWPSIQIIFEQEELIDRCQKTIKQVRTTLGQKPAEATSMIKVLNSNTRAELEQIQIVDRIETIIEIKKVLQKRNLMTQLETKSQALENVVQRFHTKFNLLNQRGLPQLVAPNNKLISLEYYSEKIYTIAIDTSKFVGIKGHVIGKTFIEALEFDLTIKHEIKHIFMNKPTFEKYTEVDEIYRKLINISIPND